MKVTVHEIRAEGVRSVEVDVPAGATAREALEAAGIPYDETIGLNAFERHLRPDSVLEPGERLEVARPIIIDPKAARERRALEQGDVRVLTCGRHGGKHRKLAS